MILTCSIAAAILGLIGVVYYPPRRIIQYLQRKHQQDIFFYKNNPVGKEIALTIDDVPYGYEKQIRGILDTYNIKVTFFLIAKKLSKEQIEFFADCVASGHQIANHGISNSIHALKSQQNFIKEVKECENSIKEIYERAGVQKPSLKLYRPGCGHFTERMKKDLRQMGYKIVLGSVYPHDPQQIIPFINFKFITSKVQGGDIVIIHDRKFTVSLLQKLLPWIQKQNYQCKTLEQFLV